MLDWRSISSIGRVKSNWILNVLASHGSLRCANTSPYFTVLSVHWFKQFNDSV